MFKSRATGFWCVLACTRRVSLSTSVEMIGDGDLGEVVEAKGRDVALFQASNGSDRESHHRKLAHRPQPGELFRHREIGTAFAGNVSWYHAYAAFALIRIRRKTSAIGEK